MMTKPTQEMIEKATRAVRKYLEHRGFERIGMHHDEGVAKAALEASGICEDLFAARQAILREGLSVEALRAQLEKTREKLREWVDHMDYHGYTDKQYKKGFIKEILKEIE